MVEEAPGRVVVTVKFPIKIYSDHKAAVNILLNLVQYDLAEHVDVGQYFIKEKAEKGIICMTCVPTTHQNGDIFIKRFSGYSFNNFISKLNMININDLA